MYFYPSSLPSLFYSTSALSSSFFSFLSPFLQTLNLKLSCGLSELVVYEGWRISEGCSPNGVMGTSKEVPQRLCVCVVRRAYNSILVWPLRAWTEQARTSREEEGGTRTSWCVVRAQIVWELTVQKVWQLWHWGLLSQSVHKSSVKYTLWINIWRRGYKYRIKKITKMYFMVLD